VSEPTRAEVRLWGMGLGLPLGRTGALPQWLTDRWNREHPDRQYEEPTRFAERSQSRPKVRRTPEDDAASRRNGRLTPERASEAARYQHGTRPAAAHPAASRRDP
jgi:hypothetical protein